MHDTLQFNARQSAVHAIGQEGSVRTSHVQFGGCALASDSNDSKAIAASSQRIDVSRH